MGKYCWVLSGSLDDIQRKSDLVVKLTIVVCSLLHSCTCGDSNVACTKLGCCHAIFSLFLCTQYAGIFLLSRRPRISSKLTLNGSKWRHRLLSGKEERWPNLKKWDKVEHQAPCGSHHFFRFIAVRGKRCGLEGCCARLHDDERPSGIPSRVALSNGYDPRKSPPKYVTSVE